jgi:hypothetical protein
MVPQPGMTRQVRDGPYGRPPPLWPQWIAPHGSESVLPRTPRAVPHGGRVLQLRCMSGFGYNGGLCVCVQGKLCSRLLSNVRRKTVRIVLQEQRWESVFRIVSTGGSLRIAAAEAPPAQYVQWCMSDLQRTFHCPFCMPPRP